MSRHFYQGIFKPKHPEKYVGNVNNIVYRSGWELHLMQKLDESPKVKKWSSEEICIPYKCPIRRSVHRYFPDFWVLFYNDKQAILEVKPKSQTKKPEKPPQRTSKRYKTEAVTYAINEAKWQAARSYCQSKGWEFMVITEEQLFPKSFA